MIIKMHRSGRSFKAAMRYLLHDKDRAETSERVAWTHTVNLAADDYDISSVVNEMLWTFRSADQLKRAAGIATSGSKLERPVKHFTIVWHPSESPTREEMIEATKRYLKFMEMDDRQAFIVAHKDTEHAHVHVILNVVSPTDGRAWKAGFEHRRTQSFALEYERQHSKIFCEERVKAPRDRTPSPPRPAHEILKRGEQAADREIKAFLKERLDYGERRDTTRLDAHEWEALKLYQRQQRGRFYAEGKALYRAAGKDAYRQIKQEFRGQWNAYYAGKRSGSRASELATLKESIMKAQKEALEKRRDQLCEALRDKRDVEKDALLKQQKVDRTQLTQLQTQGERTYRIFDILYPSDKRAQEPSNIRALNGFPLAPERRAEFEQSRMVADPREAQREVRPAFVPKKGNVKTPPVERTETKVEAERVQKAREMTDRAIEKETKGAIARSRTSWNRHRSFGRD